MRRYLAANVKKENGRYPAEERTWFRIRRGTDTAKQIFIMRQLSEKYVEFDKDLCLRNVNFKKAFDSDGDKLWKTMRQISKTPRKLVLYTGSVYYSQLYIGGGV